MRRAHSIAVLLGLTLFLFAGPPRLQSAAPTFAEWREACAKLPTNRSLGTRFPPRNLLPFKTFAEFDRVLDQFFAVATNGPMSKAESWVGDPPSKENFLNVHAGWFISSAVPFQPFARKLVLPPDARVFVEGDLHGDIHSLLKVLERLHALELLDGFQIKDPKLHVIFLGDFTDRGLYGVEVLYTLFRLKIANPDRVHFTRGNHEEVSLVARYGFLAEGQAKYGRSFNAAKVLRAYDFLPVVLYLGSGNDFVQVCHGGMEPGYDPGGLLAATGTNRFEFIDRLRQATFHREHENWLAADKESAALAAAEFKDFTPTSPIAPSVLGFMWNDFTVFSDEPAFAIDPGRAFVYGRPAVEQILKAASQGERRVRAVIRAHQHSGLVNPMMSRLVASDGLFRHWQETKSPAAESARGAALGGRLETAKSRPIPDGSVWTFNVAPDSVYGIGNDYGFATFGLLQLAEEFSNWRIQVETVDVF